MLIYFSEFLAGFGGFWWILEDIGGFLMDSTIFLCANFGWFLVCFLWVLGGFDGLVLCVF